MIIKIFILIKSSCSRHCANPTINVPLFLSLFHGSIDPQGEVEELQKTQLDSPKNWELFFFCLSLQPDTDILMCVSDASLDGHYYANSRQTPQRTSPVSKVNRVIFMGF